MLPPPRLPSRIIRPHPHYLLQVHLGGNKLNQQIVFPYLHNTYFVPPVPHVLKFSAAEIMSGQQQDTVSPPHPTLAPRSVPGEHASNSRQQNVPSEQIATSGQTGSDPQTTPATDPTQSSAAKLSHGSGRDFKFEHRNKEGIDTLAKNDDEVQKMFKTGTKDAEICWKFGVDDYVVKHYMRFISRKG